MDLSINTNDDYELRPTDFNMYLFFDTETTGLPKNWKAPTTDFDNWPRLVQIAWVLVDENGEEIEQANHIIKPDGFMIPRAVTKIHGISHEKAENDGILLSMALRQFADAMSRSQLLVAHNISFDEKVVASEFLRERIASNLETIPKICTMKISADYCKIKGRYGNKWPTLPELHYKLFDAGLEQAHNAAVDVRACVKSFFELQKLGVVDQSQLSSADFHSAD